MVSCSVRLLFLLVVSDPNFLTTILAAFLVHSQVNIHCFVGRVQREESGIPCTYRVYVRTRYKHRCVHRARLPGNECGCQTPRSRSCSGMKTETPFSNQMPTKRIFPSPESNCSKFGAPWGMLFIAKSSLENPFKINPFLSTSFPTLCCFDALQKFPEPVFTSGHLLWKRRDVRVDQQQRLLLQKKKAINNV